VRRYNEEVRYAKRREGSHRKTSQTINGRVLGYSVLEAIALVATALFQVGVCV